MGYNTYITGGFKITPQIPEADWPYDFLPEGEGDFILTQIDGDEDVKLINGVITVVGTKPGHTSAEWRWEEPGKFYGSDGSVAELVNFAKVNSAKLNGQINGEGEESGDLWRTRVVDNQVFDERPKLVWPNGEEVQL